MRIILEGPDNAGKTTLARLVTANIGHRIRYFHPGGRPKTLQDELSCMKQQERLLGEDNILIDRVTAISQQVYSPSDDSEINYWRSQGLEHLLQQNPVVIYCRPSTDRLMRFQDFTWRDGETEQFKQEIIEGQHRFIERYDKLMQTVPCLTYDFDDPIGSVIRTKLALACGGRAEDEQWFRDLINMRG
jgi:thymidylate kinase